LIRNQDQRSKDYGDIKDLYRPGHADYTFDAKYGFRDYKGGGRSSARETTARVAAGVIAKKLIRQEFGGEVIGYVSQIGHLKADIPRPEQINLDQVEKLSDGAPNIVRCPDWLMVPKMIELIETIRKNQDSIGGISEIVAKNIPAGLGEPVFDKLKADLAKALFSLPAVLGVEYGSGFACATMKGSEHNDLFQPAPINSAFDSGVTTDSNRHGGMLGGISSGLPIILRAAIKPTSSLPQSQQTVDKHGQVQSIRTKGRHDPCLLPRFVPMAEAMVAITIADHWLRWKAQCGSAPHPRQAKPNS
jgi:chorismate synthase